MINENHHKLLYSNTPTMALFYGTIKIHKENCPIRPIISFIDTPTYEMAKFVSKILTPTTKLADQKLNNSSDVISCLQKFYGAPRLFASFF